ncbi:phage tail tape measure protein [Pseudomonas moorei]|uniref:Phage tail tape measure protein, lambda family n=1 Tax=Pseudomonas moorei TaxID=395599 RepID=A0A1H1FI31_9PSED|nr:phage tail tape measure protein [Pseudomonas moorei]KAB0509689.1 phage tail tape measure protein [Pseudomonas moorei]SDR00389.1 phage tail tape measure protein, lambda family [Pseudomonas moorei]
MTQDIASLGIKVETGEVAKASTELDGLAQAGAKAEKATEGLTGQSKQAGASIKAMAAETKAAEAATAKLGKQTAAVGVSAAQTAAALRGVPAQLTDIVTSLQGGQAPLTVLLQQGGQLKDMFGGVGPAAKALGGYVAGLINPFTLAAAAAAGLGLAYYKGSQEATAYNAALILTGNAAGTSADQLGSLATQISSTIGTTGAAAEVLAQLAGSSKIAGESFGVVATAALEMQSATGKAIEETVAEFASIGKDPVAAAKTLNEQYGFLTASVYSQIVALKEQGDTIGAAKLLTDTYADTIKTRTADITANLSIWERAWKGVASETRKTLDAFNDIGRAEDAAKKIADLSQQVAYAKSAVAADPSDTDAKKKLENSQLELKFLTQQRDTQAALAAAKGLYVERQKASVNAQDKLNAGLTATASNQEKLRDRLKEIDALAKDSAAGDGGRVYTPAELNQLRDAAKKQFADKPGGSKAVNLTGYNDAQNAIKDLQATYSNSEKELEAQQKAGLITQQNYLDQRTALIRAEREEVTQAYETEISALEAVKDKSSTTGEQRIQLDQKIADARTNMVKAQKDADSQLEVLATNEEGRVKKQALAIKTYTDALQQQAVTLRQQGDREAASLGMGDRQRGLNNQLNGIDDKANAQRIDLANQYGDGSRGMSLDEYNAKLKAVAQSQQELRDITVESYDKMTVAQGDWTSGASSAWQNYLESTRDVSGQTKSLFTNAFSSMEDAVAQFALTGKLSFSDFAKSVLADMARIAARQAGSSALSGLFGLATTAAQSYFGGSSGSTQAGYTGSDYANWIKTQQAKGGAWSGGVQMFAKGGAFSDSVVSSPTAFGMANGKTGVMGEAGPEAIVPLARDSQGRLGVRGGANSSTVNVSVTVDASDGGGTMPDPARLAEAIKVVTRQEIALARRNGGQLA